MHAEYIYYAHKYTHMHVYISEKWVVFKIKMKWSEMTEHLRRDDDNHQQLYWINHI